MNWLYPGIASFLVIFVIWIFFEFIITDLWVRNDMSGLNKCIFKMVSSGQASDREGIIYVVTNSSK